MSRYGTSTRRWAARDAWEAEQIRAALMVTGGNKKAAAEMLGLNRTTFMNILKQHLRRGTLVLMEQPQTTRRQIVALPPPTPPPAISGVDA